MVNMNPLVHETIWFDKWRYEDAEVKYQEYLAGTAKQSQSQSTSKPESSDLLRQIAQARQQIQKSLETDAVATDSAVISRITKLEEENQDLRKITSDLRQLVVSLESRMAALESGSKPAAPKEPEPQKEEEQEEDDDDFELFGSDDEEESAEAAAIKAERLAMYAAKKAKKPALIAKSNIILDVKPWDDETDMAVLEQHVRSIEMDGLLWGAAKLVPLAYGIKKLQISCVVEDDKVSTDDLEEKIVGFEELVQSVDIAAFNKV